MKVASVVSVSGDEVFFDANGQQMRAMIPEGRQPGETFEAQFTLVSSNDIEWKCLQVQLAPREIVVRVPEGAGEDPRPFISFDVWQGDRVPRSQWCHVEGGEELSDCV